LISQTTIQNTTEEDQSGLTYENIVTAIGNWSGDKVDYVPYTGSTGDFYTSYFVSARGINVTTDLGTFGAGITNENTGNTNLLVPSGSGTLMLNSDQRYNDTAAIDIMFGTLTDNKWCIGDGGKVVCETNAPATASDLITINSRIDTINSTKVNYSTVDVYSNSTAYNSTLVNRLTLAASSSYVINCLMVTNSNVTTTGVQLRVNTTGTPTSVDVSYAPYGSALGYTGTSTSTNALAVLTGTVQYAPSVLWGYVITQANSNTNWTVEMRAEIATTNAWVRRGSYCEAVKVL